ncbi:DNA-binding protein [archaeon]|jgi:ssDNA-binding replication factor A large subunit|nr:DNA-binding protein [archaeon]
MKISELNAGQGNVEVEGTIKEVGEPRTFNKFGRELTVVNATLEDDSGNVKLSLWNEDATRFKAGDKVKIVNGYVSEFQGEPQLTSGKFGSIEKLDGETTPEEAPKEEPTTEEAPSEEPQEAPEQEPINEEVI